MSSVLGSWDFGAGFAGFAGFEVGVLEGGWGCDWEGDGVEVEFEGEVDWFARAARR